MDTTDTPAADRGAPTYVEQTDPLAHQQRPRDTGHIQGWGADANPADRPGFPMERTPPRLEHVHWNAPVPQVRRVQVLHSAERPGLTPVFGSTVPPAGLSGKMRELAFRYSENDLRHWLILLAADRVDVGEGLLSDLAHGHVPNLWAEMGLAAEWRHNRAGLLRKAAVTAAVAGAAFYLLRQRRARRSWPG